MIKKFLKPFSSLTITITSLSCLLVLVFVGTLAQVDLGIYLVQKKYFQSLIVFWQPAPRLKIPVFPGGFLVGSILVVNLFAVLVTRLKWTIKNAGLILLHVGLISLLLGGGMISYLATESQLVIEEGETKNYSESRREVELVVINKAHSDYDEVISIPQWMLSKKKRIKHNNLPFDIHVKGYLPNAKLSMVNGEVKASPLPIYVRDDLKNHPAAFVEWVRNGDIGGSFLLSSALGGPRKITINGDVYELFIRYKKYYTPYRLTLKAFSHDRYIGTDIPQNFSSLVHIDDSERQEDREVLIYMNHPLRYRGKTYYQASFGKNDTLSVLQVVENPGWLLPYISTLLIAFGMIIHFMKKLR